MFERLHIDFAKEGWRTSNQRDEFPQMIRWLSRQEKVFSFNRYIAKAQLSTPTPSSSSGSRKPPISIAKYPNHPNKLISLIKSTYKAPGLTKYLKEFLNTFLTDNQTSNRQAISFNLPFQCLDVYNMFRFHPASLTDDSNATDIVKAIPCSLKLLNGLFDTVVVMNTPEAEATGLLGTYDSQITFKKSNLNTKYQVL